MKTYPALPPYGWQRLILELSDETLTALLEEAKARVYQPVLVEVGGDVEDPNRCQSRLSEGVSTFSPAMKILHQHVPYAVRSRNSRFEPRTCSFMRSKPGGVEQAPHQDYTPEAIAEVTSLHEDSIPGSMIVALSPGTRLKVFAGCFDTVDTTKEKVLELRPGDAVLFRAGLIHCGMTYDQDNFRLHCYVTIPGPDFDPDIVAGVNEKMSECKHCGHLDVTSNAIRQHRAYCAENPEALKRKREKGKRTCPQCGRVFQSPGGFRTHRFRHTNCVPKPTEAEEE